VLALAREMNKLLEMRLMTFTCPDLRQCNRLHKVLGQAQVGLCAVERPREIVTQTVSGLCEKPFRRRCWNRKTNRET
jgi:hypothetical protein